MRDEPGSGAAGGLGFAAKAFFGACFRPGVEVVAELVGLADAVRGADLVITGEGRFDAQTLRGKTPFGVARSPGSRACRVIVLAGTLGEGYEQMYAHGVDAAFALASGPMSLEQACRDASRPVERTGRGHCPGLEAGGCFTALIRSFEHSMTL